jgi:hypothetical protein
MLYAVDMFCRCSCPQCGEHLKAGRMAEDVSPATHSLVDGCPRQLLSGPAWTVSREWFKEQFKKRAGCLLAHMCTGPDTNQRRG